MPTRHALRALTLVVAGTVAACGGGAAASTVPATSSVPSSAASADPSPAASSEAPTEASAGAATKLDANTATREELAAAFAAAGISNADKWAREVAEYRPYPNDPTWAQLRQELGKYNIDPAVLEQIISLLQVE